VVATTRYADTSLRQLRAPARDAADLSDVLADENIGGFAVTSVIDGTAQEVRLAVEEFLTGRSPEDLLLVYLSCHGLVDLRRRLYFAATDTVKNRLAATGVEAQWLLDQLDDCRARRQVVVLDCCFSGAFAHGAKGQTDLALGERFHGQGRGRVVLTASRGTEYSFEGEPLPESAMPGSVFTSALVAGLRTGAADTDNDGYISVDDAYAYAFDQVRAGDAQQTPQRWLYGAEGNILLARSPAGATVTPAALPEVLRTGLDSPHPAIRIGAVTALGEWLADADPARVQAARHALRHVADTDVPRVAAAAHALLEPGTPARGAAAGNDAGDLVPPAADGPAEAGGPPRAGGPGRRRRMLYAAAAAVLAIAATAAILLIRSLGDPPADGGSPAAGEFTARSPWRLVIDDKIEGEDNGCDVVLTNTVTGERKVLDTIYGTRSFQIQDTGKFRWEANDEGCLVLQRSGPGAAALPFGQESYTGDTDAFTAPRPPGKIAVQIREPDRSGTCDFELRDATDGRVVEIGSAPPGKDTLLLDPYGRSRVYLADLECTVRVSEAGKS
jgi:hypothetical protein